MDTVNTEHVRKITELQLIIANNNFDHTSKLRKMQKSLDHAHTSIEDTRQEITSVRQESTVVANRLEQTEDKTRELTRALPEADENVDYLENQSRQTNIHYEGTPESKTKSQDITEKKIKVFTEKDLKLPPRIIEWVHRVGKSTKSPELQNIVAKSASFKAKEIVVDAARKLRDLTMFVYQDYSQHVQNKKQELVPLMRNLRAKIIPAYIN